MSEFYDTLHSQALEMATDDTPLATEPILSIDETVREAGLDFYLDFEIVMAEAEKYGKNPANLGALAVYLFSDTKYYAGGFHTSPLDIDGQVHYPVFGLCVDDLKSPNLAVLNHRFRHEFRHVMQEDLTDPLYSRRWVRQAVRAAALPVAVLGWKQNIDIMVGDANYGALPALASLGSAAIVPALAPRHAIWAFTSREIDANYFAWRNKGFAPFSLRSTKD